MEKGSRRSGPLGTAAGQDILRRDRMRRGCVAAQDFFPVEAAPPPAISTATIGP
jgi:hypothetical protein